MKNNSMSKIIAIVSALLVAIGVSIGAFEHEKKKILKTLRECKLMNVAFITKWISSQDMPDYTVNYTAVYLRGPELPIYKKLKHFINPFDVVCLVIFDKASKKQIACEYFKCLEIDVELGNENFIEFPFEA